MDVSHEQNHVSWAKMGGYLQLQLSVAQKGEIGFLKVDIRVSAPPSHTRFRVQLVGSYGTVAGYI